MRILAASDESKPGDEVSGKLVYGGLVAPADAWETDFIPRWRTQVLEAYWPLDFFHTVDLRDPKKMRRSREACELKIEAAWAVVRESRFFRFATSEMALEDFRPLFGQKEVTTKSGTSTRFRAEHLAFTNYVFEVLRVVASEFSEASRIDFVFEGADKETNAVFVDLFRSIKHEALPGLRLDRHAELLGEIEHRGKAHIPLQAADLLTWHARRIASGGKLNARERALFDEATGRIGIRDVRDAHNLATFHRRIEAAIQTFERLSREGDTRTESEFLRDVVRGESSEPV